MHGSFITAAGAAALVLAGAVGAKSDTPSKTDGALVAPHANGCLATGNGYLRARIRGALNLDINLGNAELECEGGARPDGSGIRVAFAGPARSDGRRLRMVFGLGTASEGVPGRALPTNLTVIFEGEERLFATRGEERCTVDELTQERVGALGGNTRSYRVVARGFCVEPANALNKNERILVSSFDFAGRVTFDSTAPPPADNVSAMTKPELP